MENVTVSAFLSANNVTLDPEMQALIDYYKDLSRSLRLYVTPVIIFGGTVGNLLTIAVVLSHHFRYTPSIVPLIALAFVDIGVLYFNLLDVWLGALMGADSLQFTRGMSSAGCKFSTFSTVFLTQFSSWILVLINIDRVVSVYKPLKARTWCTRRRLLVALAAIMGVLALISVHVFWTAVHDPNRDSDRCQYDEDLLGEKGMLAWTTIDASLFTFIPFLLILTCNLAITWSLIKTRRRRKKNMHVHNSVPSDHTTSITTMLITISVVFLVTTSPLTVAYQFYDALMLRFEHDPVGKALWYELVINTVLVLVCYSNNAVNFLLYCLSGSKFRHALGDVCAGRIGSRYDYPRSTIRGRSLRTSLDHLGPIGMKKMNQPDCLMDHKRQELCRSEYEDSLTGFITG